MLSLIVDRVEPILCNKSTCAVSVFFAADFTVTETMLLIALNS